VVFLSKPKLKGAWISLQSLRGPRNQVPKLKGAVQMDAFFSLSAFFSRWEEKKEK